MFTTSKLPAYHGSNIVMGRYTEKPNRYRIFKKNRHRYRRRYLKNRKYRETDETKSKISDISVLVKPQLQCCTCSVLIPGSRNPGPFFNPEIPGFEPSNPGISRLKFILMRIKLLTT